MFIKCSIQKRKIAIFRLSLSNNIDVLREKLFNSIVKGGSGSDQEEVILCNVIQWSKKEIVCCILLKCHKIEHEDYQQMKPCSQFSMKRRASEDHKPTELCLQPTATASATSAPSFPAARISRRKAFLLGLARAKAKIKWVSKWQISFIYIFNNQFCLLWFAAS